MNRIETLLREKIGVDTASIGPAIMAQVLRRRMTECRVADIEAYWQRLQRDPAEVTALIEAVVVPETWFFRDADTWTALQEIACTWLLQTEPRHILSAPCSTGEEAYSIAITLLEAGLPAASFDIEAMDLSEAALKVARRAVYGRNSFRGDEADEQKRWFRTEAGGATLIEAARRPVRLRQGNLLTATWPAEPGFDLIFCRNVLIYFDAATQTAVLERLSAALAPGGILFVGAAEAFLTHAHGLVSAGHPGAFRRPEPAPLRPLKIRGPKPLPRPRKVRPEPRPPEEQPEQPVSPDLAAVTRLADEGSLAEARTACATWLETHETSADGHCLLGVVRDSLGDAAGARESYRRALYLEPEHPEALRHLALLSEREGDPESARRLHLRAARHGEEAAHS